MTVLEQTPIATSTANGVTTTFPHAFTLLAADDLVVMGVADGATSIYTLGVDYTVTGVGLDAGAVVFISPPSNGAVITRFRTTKRQRLTAYQSGGDLPAETLNADLDRLVLMVQDLFVGGNAAPNILRAPAGEFLSELPAASDRAGYLLGFDGAGNRALVPGQSGTATLLALDLLSADAAKGAALVAFNPQHSYAAGTIGRQTPWVVCTASGGDDTAVVQAALNTGKHVLFVGSLKAAGLVQNTIGQQLVFINDASLEKNANGPILTSSARDVRVFHGMFRGASPAFTGDNVVSTGDNFGMYDCGSSWAAGRAVRASGNRCIIKGTREAYHTADPAGYDIEVGASGSPTLYHQLDNIYTSQAGGGVKFVECGSHTLTASQIGKLYVAAGAAGAGVNGGMFTQLRILGASVVELSNATFAACQLSAVTLTFALGTSGCSWDRSNVIASGGSLVNNGNANNLLEQQISAGGSLDIRTGGSASAHVVKVDAANGSTEHAGDFLFPNTKFVRFRDAGGTLAGAVGMSGSNISMQNTVGAVQIAVPAAASAQFLVGGTQRASVDANGLSNALATRLMSSSVTLNNGAAAAAGTLTNAPSAGNPTKWIPINDNGVTRHIPAW